MSASKDRPRWDQLPPWIRSAIERLIGGSVVHVRNCPGGYSPGFASLLTLTGGRRVFVKAMDGDRWRIDATYHRMEARVSAALPATVPAPRLLGSCEESSWIVLAFDAVDGIAPEQPWTTTDLGRVAAALPQVAEAGTSLPIALPSDHPRLGGWAALAGDRAHLARLGRHSEWAVEHIGRLIDLEGAGRAAARGNGLVHFDLSPHNILLTPTQVRFVDWPHARLGAPLIDLIIVLSSATEVDREPILTSHPASRTAQPDTMDAILAAHTGFLLRGGVTPKPPGLEAIAGIDLRLGLAALSWLQQRLTREP